MYYFLICLMFMHLSIILIKSLFNKSCFNLFFVAFVLFYIFIRPLMVLSGFYYDFRPLDEFHNIPMSDYDIFAFTACFSFYITYIFCRKQIAIADDVIRSSFHRGENNKLALIFTALIFLPILSYASLLIVMAAFLISRRSFALNLITVLTIVFYLIFSEERRDYLYVVIFFSSIFLMKNKVINGLLKKSMLIGVALLLLISIFLMVISIRNSDSLRMVMSGQDKEIALRVFEIETDFSIVNDDLIFLISETYKDPIDNLNGALLIKPFLIFFPRSVLENKPETSSRVFAEKYHSDFYAHGGSLPTTILGDVLLSFGALGLFIFPIFIKLIIYLTACKKFPVFICTFLLILPSFVRGPLDYFIYAMAAPLMYVLLCQFFYFIKVSIKNANNH